MKFYSKSLYTLIHSKTLSYTFKYVDECCYVRVSISEQVTIIKVAYPDKSTPSIPKIDDKFNVIKLKGNIRQSSTKKASNTKDKEEKD